MGVSCCADARTRDRQKPPSSKAPDRRCLQSDTETLTPPEAAPLQHFVFPQRRVIRPRLQATADGV